MSLNWYNGGNILRKMKFIALMSILACLLIVIPTGFAADNATALGLNDTSDVLGADYYFDANVENDTGDGTLDNPYKNLTDERIKSDSVIHLADGEYELDDSKTIRNVTIIGQHVESTIIKFYGTGFKVSTNLNLQNVTLLNLAITDNGNANINANNVIFKNSLSSAIKSTYAGTTINLYNCTFFNNTADYGGAININMGTLNIDDTLFDSNSARLYGGAIAGQSESTFITVKKSRFMNDYSRQDAGGAIYILDSLKLYCQDTEFINCSATFGGAVTSLRSNSTFINITERDNKAKYDGGAIYAMYQILSVFNSTFMNNSAKNAGAVYADGLNLYISNNGFERNTASKNAGAVYSLANKLSSSSILDESLNNSFSNNSAGIYDDVFESESVNLTIGSNDYLLIRYNSTFDGTLPSSYDLRKDHYVTPVKNQGQNGNCWAFASIASLESCILKATGKIYDLSESNMKNIMALFSDYGWDMYPNTGGYDKMGYGYLVSWLGPINETDDEYNIGTVVSPVLNSMFHIQNVLFLQRNDPLDNDAIKRAILEYGAVATSIYWAGAYTGNHYYNGDKGANHAVTIVGWDDNYSRTKFSTRPPGDGAWIIKNSWGPNSGLNGYYYVSYYDAVCAKPGALEKNFVFVFNDSIKYDKNYQYDIAGKTDYLYNYYSNVLYKNIFKASDNEYLTAVSTYFDRQTNWNLSIYVNGLLKHTQVGSSPNSYSTIELTQYIPLNIGDFFEVVFNITVDGDAGVPISEAVSLNKELYSRGISFISYDGEHWDDLYDFSVSYPGHTYASQVACIKAFTVLNPVNTTINLTVENTDSPSIIKALVLNEYGNPVLSGNVTFNIEGQDYVVDIVNGYASLFHVFKNFGANLITASFEKTGFISSSSNVTVDISKGDIEIALYSTVGLLDAHISITLSKPINETVYVNVNQSIHEVTVTDGVGKLDLTDLYYGKYDVEAYFVNDYYNCVNGTDSFNINYLKTFIEASDAEAYHNDDFTYSIRLLDRNNNPISGKTIRFTVCKVTKENTTNDEGIASVNFKLDVGRYAIDVSCPYDGKCLESEISKNILIKSTISLPAATKYTFNSSYIVYLLDVNGQKLANEEVTLAIGANNYTLKTDSNGMLSYDIYLTPGSYNIIVNNLNTGEVKTQNINVVKRITENKALTMYYGAGSSYKVRIFDDNGNVAENAKVKLTVNGKSYYKYSDSNGYASLKISLKPNKYTITAEYKGFKVSNKITVKSTIIAKDKTVKKGKTIKFKAKLLNSKGKILKNKKLTFKFKGKTYKVKTNSKGIATLKITKRYKVGKYTISTKYCALKIKNKITIKK